MSHSPLITRTRTKCEFVVQNLCKIHLTKNCWGFGILPIVWYSKTRKHDVSETGHVSLFTWEGQTPTLLGPLERANLNYWTQWTGDEVGGHPFLISNFNHWTTNGKSKFKVILRPTISRPVRLGVRLPYGTRDQFFSFLLQEFSDMHRFVDVGRPLWREVRSVLFNCCGTSRAQSFSVLVPRDSWTMSFCLL
jgi:hypothetical protein